jgi:putative ubiquitin-RnfH superfamily antitoxin RatB of RatAB toxin-antitoxin module
MQIPKYQEIEISVVKQGTNTQNESAKNLMRFLSINSVEVAMNLPLRYQMSLTNIQISRTFELCKVAKKVFQLEKEESLKLTCAVIAMFNKSIKVTTDKMNGVEIYESAVMFCEKYTHESISDLMHCLKIAKTGEFGVMYNRFDTFTMFEYFRKYLDKKYSFLENETKMQKSITDGSVNTEYLREAQHADRKKQQKINDDEWKQAVQIIDLKYQNEVYQS